MKMVITAAIASVVLALSVFAGTARAGEWSPFTVGGSAVYCGDHEDFQVQADDGLYYRCDHGAWSAGQDGAWGS
jgi:hypothetical protein